MSPIKEQEKINSIKKLNFNVISINKGILTLRCKENHTFIRRWSDISKGIVNCIECENIKRKTSLKVMDLS